MRQLALENEPLIHDLFYNTEFSGVMKEEIAIIKIFQNGCKYLSFILHPDT
jgi:hypothetical protein